MCPAVLVLILCPSHCKERPPQAAQHTGLVAFRHVRAAFPPAAGHHTLSLYINTQCIWTTRKEALSIHTPQGRKATCHGRPSLAPGAFHNLTFKAPIQR